MTTAGGMQQIIISAEPSTTGTSTQVLCVVNAVSEVSAQTQQMAIKTLMETVATGIRTTEPRVGISIPTNSKHLRCAVFAVAEPEVPPLMVAEILSQKCASTQILTQQTTHMTVVSGTVPERAHAVTTMIMISVQRRCAAVAVVEATQKQ